MTFNTTRHSEQSEMSMTATCNEKKKSLF